MFFTKLKTLYPTLTYSETKIADYILANKDETLYTITDVGEIEAYSYVIEQKEIWKNRIYGFLFGVATTLTGMLVKFLIGLL